VNLPFFIAKRYLLAKKSHNLINIITGVSVAGIAVGAFALIVVLSVFNGFEKVISGMVNSVAPHFVIEPKTGKTLKLDAFPIDKLKAVQGIFAVSPVIEEDALFRYNERQHIGRIKAVSAVYQEQGLIDSTLVDGSFVTLAGTKNFAVIGAGVAWYLGVSMNNLAEPLIVYAPRRGDPSRFTLDQGFVSRPVQIAGVYASQQEFDVKYIYVDFNWASDLLEYSGEATAIEVFALHSANTKRLQLQIEELSGDSYHVKNRMQQQETLYKILKAEKWAIFIILTFILIMATFNVIGSLTMLIVEKQKDRAILHSLGAGKSLIRKLFVTEGLLISVTGGLLGLLIGVAVILIQQYFGLLKLGGSGAFVIDAYPVWLRLEDVTAVFLTVLVIGGVSSVITVYQALKNLETQKSTGV